MTIVLALSITVDTAIHTATVYFSYANPKNITKFVATIVYCDSSYHYEYEGCSVKVTTSPLRCSIQHLYEAVDFDVFARACNDEVCEPPVVMRARTKLRGAYLYYLNVLIKQAFNKPIFT